MSALTPTTTITIAQVSPNGYAWGGGSGGVAYPAIYENGSDRFVTMSKIVGYNGSDQDTAQYYIEVLKNSADPWVLQDSANRPRFWNWGKFAPVDFFSIYNTTFATVQIENILWCFYFLNAATIADSPLACKPFDMNTGLWGAEIVSTVTQFPTVEAPTSGGKYSLTGICASLDQSTGKVYVVAAERTIAVGGNFRLRQGYAAFDSGAASWLTASAFVLMGSDATVNADETTCTTACDCNGTLYTIFQSQNFSTNITTYFYQALNPDGTLSAVQSTGITQPANTVSGIKSALSRLLLTPTEMVLVYGDLWDGLSHFHRINTARSPLPAALSLPAWSLGIVLDLTGAPGTPGFEHWLPFYIPTDELVISYYWEWANSFQGKLSLLHWNGAMWVDDFSPSATVPFALTNGPIINEDANITYDFTAPVTLVGFPADLGTRAQQLYSLLSNTTRTCPIPPIVTLDASVGASFTFGTTGGGTIASASHTLCAINTATAGTLTDTPYIVRKYAFNSEPMPQDVIYFTPWSDLGWQYQKTARNLLLDIDTGGIAASVQLETDGGSAQTFAVTTTSHDRDRVFATNSDLEGKLWRLTLLPGTNGKTQLFKAALDFVPDCNILTYADSLEQNFGYPSWKYLKEVWVYYKGGPLTITILVDGGLTFYSHTLPAVTVRSVERFYLPASNAGILNKSKKYRIQISAANGFRLYNNSVLEWYGFSADELGSFNLMNIHPEMMQNIGQQTTGAWSL